MMLQKSLIEFQSENEVNGTYFHQKNTYCESKNMFYFDAEDLNNQKAVMEFSK